MKFIYILSAPALNCLIFLLLPLAALAEKPAVMDVNLMQDYAPDPSPLRTENIWRLDPGELNPQRRHWLLSRKVEMTGLETVKLPDNRVGVKLSGIVVTTRGYFRFESPYFQPLSFFPCTARPSESNAVFATEEGSKRAAEGAAHLWEAELKKERLKLGWALARIEAETKEDAISEANLVFNLWLNDRTRAWRESAFEATRETEWKFYQEAAKSAGICKNLKPVAKPSTLPSWHDVMEPPAVISDDSPSGNKLLARAPARLWSGIFSIRATISYGARPLDGRFLVDSGAKTSLLSPAWMESQGLLPVQAEVAQAPPQRVTWSGFAKPPGGLGKPLYVQKIEASFFPIALHDFLLFDPAFFDTPRSVAPCCDGLLGGDFLHEYVLEFQSAAPSELRFWAPEGFVAPSDYFWAEAHFLPGGQLVSDCWAEQDHKSILNSRGATWELGNEAGLEVPATLRAGAGPHPKFNIVCDGQSLGHEFPASSDSRGNRATVTPLRIGMEILNRSNFFLDLPHGRIWFPKDVAEVPIPENRSGLILEFFDRRGDRALKVIDARKGSADLGEGVRPVKGSEILEVDGIASSEMDLWQVNRRLSGVYGGSVRLKWKNGKGPVQTTTLGVGKPKS
jgi:hypothetical protein